MNIDRFKKEDGYYDENNCFYENAESLLQAKILGFCDCGDSILSLKHTQIALRQVSNLKELVWERKQTWEEWYRINIELLGNENSVYFMWYWLDSKGFTEHGSSVPGWLTTKGQSLLADLDEFFQRLENKKENHEH